MSSVSVIVATIPGREGQLKRALDSVYSQHRLPDEVIVEPDPERTSAASTRNRALARATSDYIAVLDDDDYLLKNHIKVLMHVAEAEPEHDVIYPTPDIRGMLDPTPFRLNGVRTEPWGLDWTEQHRQFLIQVNNFIPVTSLYKSETLRELGGWPEPDHPSRKISSCEDWLLHRKLALKNKKFKHINVKTWVWEPNPLGHTGGN